MGVEVLKVEKGLGIVVEGMEYGEGDSRGEVANSASVKINVVYVGRCDAAGGVDDSVVVFGGCKVEVEDVHGGWA